MTPTIINDLPLGTTFTAADYGWHCVITDFYGMKSCTTSDGAIMFVGNAPSFTLNATDIITPKAGD